MNDNRMLIALAVAAIAVTGVARAAAVEQRNSRVPSKSAASVETTRALVPVPVPSAVGTSPAATAAAGTVVTTVTTAASPGAPRTAPVKPATTAPASRAAAPGDVVRFGRMGGEALLWRILSADTQRVVLLADAAVIGGPYQSDEYASDTSDYARSSVRAWLRDEFVPAAFGANAQDDPALGRSSASDAVAGDIAYLLTARQVERYLPEAEDRIAGGTSWARSNQGYGGVALPAGPVYWWLAAEPVAEATNVVPVVQTNGGINAHRYAAVAGDGVRPAIRLNMSAVKLVAVSDRPGLFDVRSR
jgi:hypothetical protein